MLDIKITKTTDPKPKPDGPLGFGQIFTDHMFLMDYTAQTGWHDPRIVPYADFTLSPACTVFHYGQAAFEGLKAYQGTEGDIFLFRPDKNAQRANATADRLCIPHIPVEDYVQAIQALVKLDAHWVPTEPGTTLYIRPFIIATEPHLGVSPAKNYLFAIIMSPSGNYFTDGLSSVSIWVEDEYVRAVRGGVGFAKTGGNYAASLAAQARAQEAGFSQVLWLDGVERRYIEEVGAMNIFFKIAGKVITPALSGSILPGITRDSVITLCHDWGIAVEERPISIDEVVSAYQSGILEEVFGTGTAAVITPVGTLGYQGARMTIADGHTGALSERLYDTITGIQQGKLADNHRWRRKV